MEPLGTCQQLNDSIQENQVEKVRLKSCVSKDRKDTSNLKEGMKDGFQGSVQEGGCGDVGITQIDPLV